jgi:Flp pilus assembly protein TadD
VAAQGLFLEQQNNPGWGEAAEIVLREALEGDPNMVDAMNWLGNALQIQGKTDEADALLEHAFEIDPLSPTIASNLARLIAEEGDILRAELMLLRLIDLPDPSRRPFLALRQLYAQTGQLVKMNAIAKRGAVALVYVYYGLQLNYALLGQWQLVDAWVERTNRDFPEHWFAGFNLANVSMWSGDYGEAVRILNRELAASGQNLDDLNEYFSYYLGLNQALSGDYAAAVDTLEGIYADGDKDMFFGEEIESGGPHCLAWSYLRLGDQGKANALLQRVEKQLGSRLARLPESYSAWWHLSATTALLQGDRDLALDRLERAIDAGWRGYYLIHHSPIWESVAQDARYQALMAGVKADVDRQRAEVERIDAEEDFPALLDRVRASRQ